MEPTALPDFFLRCAGYNGPYRVCPAVNPALVAEANHAVVGAVILGIVIVSVVLLGALVLLLFAGDN